ncbi:hypothetical protein B484DRAFT_460331 [Ochromonadaceae sp. CCMP2298]|nr:hypothetical protein B484DRAFT_460331 [Ochromonadaceae sp. CCMP2298]
MRYCLLLMLLSLFRSAALRPTQRPTQRLFSRIAPTKAVSVTAGLQSILLQPSDGADADELVTVKNTQRKIPIDTDAVREQIKTLKSILGVSDFACPRNYSFLISPPSPWLMRLHNSCHISYPVCTQYSHVPVHSPSPDA